MIIVSRWLRISAGCQWQWHSTKLAPWELLGYLDKLAFRYRQRIRAWQEVANDGLQMAITQKSRGHKGPHPRRGFSTVEPFLYGAHAGA
jgi:hypothetical protein